MAFEGLKARAAALEAELYALAVAVRDPRTPTLVKVLVVLLVAYAVSPIDLVPDFVPVLGYLDDLVVLPVGVAVALRLIPADVVADCRARAADELNHTKARWVVAGIVLCLWLLVGALLLRVFTNWV